MEVSPLTGAGTLVDTNNCLDDLDSGSWNPNGIDASWSCRPNPGAREVGDFPSVLGLLELQVPTAPHNHCLA